MDASATSGSALVTALVAVDYRKDIRCAESRAIDAEIVDASVEVWVGRIL
jgi:hypothetical protein